MTFACKVSLAHGSHSRLSAFKMLYGRRRQGMTILHQTLLGGPTTTTNVVADFSASSSDPAG